ncbi:hypothetical protein MKW92_041816 [Papaver armeniacum]|nr:hypothetical protein MKW92_041816 [Papaver armeniacum]
MNTQQQDDHIIMFPFMAQGHIIPFLALAKLISQRKPNTKITLVSTPLNIKYLHSTLTSETSTAYKNISLAELPFSCTDHGLFHASETLKPSFNNLITEIIRTEKRVPGCIISDIFLGWVNETAKRVGTLHFSFTTCEFHLPKFPDTCRLHISQLTLNLRETDKETPITIFLQQQISLSLRSDGMLCNSVEEIEILGLETLRSYMDPKPIRCIFQHIGPLLPPFLLGNGSAVSNLRTAGKDFGISPENCIKWLNHKKHN